MSSATVTARTEVHRIRGVLDDRVKADSVRRRNNASLRRKRIAAEKARIQAESDRLVIFHELRDANLYIHALEQDSDANERVTVCARGFLSRLRWALGVAWRGTFRWQRT